MKFGTRTGVLKLPRREHFRGRSRSGSTESSSTWRASTSRTCCGRLRGASACSTWRETGVEVSSVCLGALWGQTFAADDAGARERAREIVTSAATFTPRWGRR